MTRRWPCASRTPARRVPPAGGGARAGPRDPRSARRRPVGASRARDTNPRTVPPRPRRSGSSHRRSFGTAGSTRRSPTGRRRGVDEEPRRRRRALHRTRALRRRRAATSTAPGLRRCGAGDTARRDTRRRTTSRWPYRSSRNGCRGACCLRAPGPPRTRDRPPPGRSGRARRSALAVPRARTPMCCSTRRRD